MRYITMKRLFAEDADRFKKFSLSFSDIFFDYSKNIITPKTLQLLLQLADDCKVKDAIEKIKAMEDPKEAVKTLDALYALQQLMNLQSLKEGQ